MRAIGILTHFKGQQTWVGEMAKLLRDAKQTVADCATDQLDPLRITEYHQRYE